MSGKVKKIEKGKALPFLLFVDKEGKECKGFRPARLMKKKEE